MVTGMVTMPLNSTIEGLYSGATAQDYSAGKRDQRTVLESGEKNVGLGFQILLYEDHQGA